MGHQSDFRSMCATWKSWKPTYGVTLVPYPRDFSTQTQLQCPLIFTSNLLSVNGCHWDILMSRNGTNKIRRVNIHAVCCDSRNSVCACSQTGLRRSLLCARVPPLLCPHCRCGWADALPSVCQLVYKWKRTVSEADRPALCRI